MMLDVQELDVTYNTGKGRVKALDSFTLSIDENEIVALAGECGCGKSTLGLAIIRLLPKWISKISNGRIFFKGTDITDLSEKEMRDHQHFHDIPGANYSSKPGSC